MSRTSTGPIHSQVEYDRSGGYSSLNMELLVTRTKDSKPQAVVVIKDSYVSSVHSIFKRLNTIVNVQYDCNNIKSFVVKCINVVLMFVKTSILLKQDRCVSILLLTLSVTLMFSKFAFFAKFL